MVRQELESEKKHSRKGIMVEFGQDMRAHNYAFKHNSTSRRSFDKTLLKCLSIFCRLGKIGNGRNGKHSAIYLPLFTRRQYAPFYPSHFLHSILLLILQQRLNVQTDWKTILYVKNNSSWYITYIG